MYVTDGHRDIKSFYTLNYALSHDTYVRLCGYSAVYHRKLHVHVGLRTIRLNLVTNRLLIS